MARRALYLEVTENASYRDCRDLRSWGEQKHQPFRSAADHTVNIANKRGSEEVRRDWLLDGKFESRGGFALDSTRRRRQHNELQAADK